MALDSAVGRSVPYRSSKVSQRSRTSTKRHGSTRAVTEDIESKQPDVEEIRQRRAAYYERPVAERQKVIRPRTSHVSAASSKTKPSSEPDRRRKKKPDTSSRSRTTKSLSKDERKAEGYVYSAVRNADVAEPRLEPVVEVEVPDAAGTQRDERRRPASHRSSRSRTSVNVIEDEVTPDDSISVVAERQASRTSLRPSTTRPVVKRSSTSISKLHPIDEEERTTSSTTARRKSTRDSTLLGSLFRRHSTTAVPAPPRLVECLTCGSDDVPHTQSAKLGCGHRMCNKCLKRVFEMSVKDPAHMPPRCCAEDHIPLKHVDRLFDIKFKTLWNRKYQEYHTKNRIYCPAAKCGEWIKPSNIHRDSQGRKYASCPRCKTKVCTLCNNKSHRSRQCPEDPEIAKLVAQAKEKGWQRCFSCNTMVELKEGCNHMTCRCMAEFCMICGSKWKTCDCPWFNYTNLQDADRLLNMRVPEPVQVLLRRVYAAPQAAAPAQPVPGPNQAFARNDAPPPTPRRRDRTYRQELNDRQRQEQQDEDLARRLQLATLLGNNHDDTNPRQRQRDETFGLGNAAGHFMNDDFVQNATNVIMDTFGDANLGRRRDRASGRRRRARETEGSPAGGGGGNDAGLAPNFLGDESVLGMAPGRRPGLGA
ncbi:hypothetical protein LTR86_002267 [Recurvomyces mirabilis]|nr:hypothetical protein LTR86_002267 [Recurvomyces mirabilis]